MLLLDGKTLTSASWNYITRLFNTDLWVILRTVEGYPDSMSAITLSQRNETLAFKSTSCIQIIALEVTLCSRENQYTIQGNSYT